MCPDCNIELKPQVLRSGGGHYIGTQCHCGPYSRESVYFFDKDVASMALKYGAYERDARTPFDDELRADRGTLLTVMADQTIQWIPASKAQCLSTLDSALSKGKPKNLDPAVFEEAVATFQAINGQPPDSAL